MKLEAECLIEILREHAGRASQGDGVLRGAKRHARAVAIFVDGCGDKATPQEIAALAFARPRLAWHELFW